MNTRFRTAIKLIDETNAQDPNRETWKGESLPKELAYGRRMSEWLDKLEPDASEALRLAVRSQHIARWKIPRSQYPDGRAGYKQWRSDLAAFHADTAAELLLQSGYEDDTIERVKTLILKRRLKTDSEVQLLEDTACLVFLDAYFDDFAERYDDEKLIDILRKTWFKMSPLGHKHALQLKLSERASSLIQRALEEKL